MLLQQNQNVGVTLELGSGWKLKELSGRCASKNLRYQYSVLAIQSSPLDLEDATRKDLYRKKKMALEQRGSLSSNSRKFANTKLWKVENVPI